MCGKYTTRKWSGFFQLKSPPCTTSRRLEPTIGLHPLDVAQLLGVFDRLVEQGATVVVIEHDLDVIANADYVIDLGPGGGASGGRIAAAGTPEEVAADPDSVTGRYL